MNFYRQYLSSLKHPEAEEVLDIYFFRPLAFIIVRTLYNTPITPNMYSGLALISGIMSGFHFYQGNAYGNRWGALYFLLFAVFDCCDGMLARMKKNGTPLGRIIDGLVDYSVNIIVYLAIAIAYSKTNSSQMALLLAFSGIVKALNSVIYEHYQTEYINSIEGKSDFCVNEQKKTIAELEKGGISAREKLAKHIYLIYLKLQIPTTSSCENNVPAQIYREHNLMPLRLWGIIGPAVHILVLVVSFYANHPEWLVAYSLIFGVGWLAIMKIVQKYIDKKVLKISQTQAT